jgi:hypothetical protein
LMLHVCSRSDGTLSVVTGEPQTYQRNAICEREGVRSDGVPAPDACGPDGKHWMPRPPAPPVPPKPEFPPTRLETEGGLFSWLTRLFRRQPKPPIQHVRPQAFEKIAKWQDEIDGKRISR